MRSGEWQAGKEASKEILAVAEGMPGDSHCLGVVIAPTKRKT